MSGEMGKIEVNDNAELRELLSKAIKRLEHVTGCDMHRFHPDATSCDGKISTGECRHKRTCELIFEARKALAKPQRNCDVGTAEEQAKRLDAFCDSHGHGFDGQKCYSCENCKLISIDRCELAWAQMPYDSEVSNG